MLDVHPPHQSIHGWKDFLLHLLTITIGLLIALSLEGCVERHRQNHLLHEAEDAMRVEMAQNANTLALVGHQISAEQKQLDGDQITLSTLRETPKADHPQFSFSLAMHSFDDMAWRTAQTSGALGYMPYAEAQKYSDIYGAQAAVVAMEKEAVEDAMHSASLVSTQPKDWQPTAAQVDELSERIGMLQMRLGVLSSYIDALDQHLRKIDSNHR
jgi:hypothetical protein